MHKVGSTELTTALLYIYICTTYIHTYIHTYAYGPPYLPPSPHFPSSMEDGQVTSKKSELSLTYRSILKIDKRLEGDVPPPPHPPSTHGMCVCVCVLCQDAAPGAKEKRDVLCISLGRKAEPQQSTKIYHLLSIQGAGPSTRQVPSHPPSGPSPISDTLHHASRPSASTLIIKGYSNHKRDIK